MAEKVGIFSSLRFKVALLLALFGGGLMLVAMGLVDQDIRQSLVAESIEKGLGIARGVAFHAEDPLLTGDDLYLFSAIGYAARAPGVRYALIVDEQGIIEAADVMERVGKPFVLPPPAERVREGEDFLVRRIFLDGTPVLDLSVPILTVAEPTLRLGEIHLGLSEGVIGAAVGKMRLRLILLTLAALLAGSLVAYLLAKFFLRPVDTLVQGVRAIGEGNLEQRIDLRRRDELGLLTRAFNEMAESLREKDFIQNTFERYVSQPLARQILARKNELQLGGEEKEATVLFCDIRGFTTLAEHLAPPQVVELLNGYFTRMVGVIGAHEGMVDKFMGDAVMALFGVPFGRGEEPLRAVQCALALRQAVQSFNEERRRSGLPALAVGIGINTGPVVAGNIGSQQRMEYTVIGDTVNIASRLQSIAAPGEILVSEATFRRMADKVRATALEPMTLKGKSVPVGVYRIDEVAPARRAEAAPGTDTPIK